jgi:membrane-associated protease RseP (regulator of RpoE activity)
VMNDQPGAPESDGRYAGSSSVRRWLVILVAITYAGYLALLVTSDLSRVAPLGFRASFTSGYMMIEDVVPGSIASRAGLRVGDRIAHANGQSIEGGATGSGCVFISTRSRLSR